MQPFGCTRLAENTEHKKSPKTRHLGTIAQLWRSISSQLRHVSTIGKSLLNSNITSTCPHMLTIVNFGPASGWDLLASLGHLSKFERVSSVSVGSVTARHSSSEPQPNFAALNRGRHLYSAGRPSRWALAQILVFDLNFKGIARTQTPTTKNYALELPAFEVIAGVNLTEVQWKGLALGIGLADHRYPRAR